MLPSDSQASASHGDVRGGEELQTAASCCWVGQSGLPCLGRVPRNTTVAPERPEHSGNLPTYQTTGDSHSPSPGFLLPPQNPWDSHLLYIRVGVSIWENIRVFLAEDMAHSAAGDDFEAAAAHPHSEGNFCKIVVPPQHGSVLSGGEGTQDGSIGGTRPKEGVRASCCIQPGAGG